MDSVGDLVEDKGDRASRFGCTVEIGRLLMDKFEILTQSLKYAWK